jgi:glycosyltransferase involved in cell wall biosynthesis
MHVMHIIAVVTAWLIAVAWLYKLLEAAFGLRRVPNLLAAKYDAAPMLGPSVTVIVPARNEAAGIGACLESLVGQDYNDLKIIAVDDRSSDETGALMDGLARSHRDRLHVLHLESLPVGWLGKTHAMARGARLAIAEQDPDYLLFTDGDIVFHQDAIRRAMAEALATNAGHFVLLPTTLVKNWGEGMVLAFLQVAALWAVRTWRVADPKAMRDAIGVGAFNLIRTAAYEQLGGFEATPMEILEDLYLGRRVKRAGLRQRVATAPGMVSLHWAAGVFGILNGMTKNIFAVFRFRPVLLFAAAAGMILGCVVPVGFLAFSPTRLAAGVALGSVAGLYFLSSRTSRISSWYAALFPVAAALVVYSMLRSMLITVLRGGVTWRGTWYPLAELREHLDCIHNHH